ncbi:MAG: EamA family transporter [Chlorobi bacterium]|nr:EamA family transporter [Chlorobiota bacterium]
MFKNKAVVGSLAIGIAAIMWGFDGVVLTPRLYNLNIAFVVFVLHVFPFLLMNIFMPKQYRYISNFSFNDFIILFLIAIMGGVLGTISIVKALFLVNFNNLSIVVLLQKIQPVFAIILAAIFLKEKITKYFFGWAFLAILAGYTLTFGFNAPVFDSNSNMEYAAFFALLAAFSFGSSTVFSKMALQKYNFKTTTFYRYGITSIIMFSYVALSGKLDQFHVVTNLNWIYFIIIAITTGSGAIFLYYFGLKNVKAIVSVIVELLFPVSTILIDYLVNNNKLSVIQWVSAIIMVFAVINLNRAHIKFKIFSNKQIKLFR